MLLEELSNGQLDKMAIYSGALQYTVIQESQVLYQIGGGILGIDDTGGFIISNRVKLFPRPPFIINGEIDAGFVGDAFFSRILTGSGIIFNRIEFDLNFQLIKVGKESLYGSQMGISLWF
jgi:hypothetical protein